MTIQSKKYLEYSVAMDKFHHIMQEYINCDWYPKYTLLGHYHNALADFVEWTDSQPGIIPWTVHRRLKQLNEIFYKISLGRCIHDSYHVSAFTGPIPLD